MDAILELKALQYTIDECQSVMDQITQTDFTGNRDQQYVKCYRKQIQAYNRLREIINNEL